MLRPNPHKLRLSDFEMEVGASPSNADDEKISLRLSHCSKSSGLRPGKSPPFQWSHVIPTHRREQAIEGMLMGGAVADAISLSRDGLHPRISLKLFGRSPIHFQFQPGMGVTSQRTHQMLMTIQAMLESKTDKELFANSLRNRIAWYQRAFPWQHAKQHIAKIYQRLFRIVSDDSMKTGFADDPLLRSVVLAVMLQGNMNSSSRWFQKCVEVSHLDNLALHAGVLVGYAAQIAQIVDPVNFDPLQAIDRLQASTDEPKLSWMLNEMRESLSENRSVAYVARQFGWADGIPSDLFATSIMGIYAWLRHPKNYRNCIERSSLLGGACGDVAVLAGSLSGIHLGKDRIPNSWLQRLTMFPYSKHWQELAIERVKDWPHGVEDIQRASGVPSLFLGQIVRNLSGTVFRTIHAMIRLPMQLTQFSVGNRS
jgi:ADP-ribosylglycohydrolase